MFEGLRFELVWFQLKVLDHGDNQYLLSPTQDLPNDVSYVGLSETFIISTCINLASIDLKTCKDMI